MTIEDKLCAEIMVKYNKMQDMLCRVSNELNDPTGSRWGDHFADDRSLIEHLRDDVDRFLEEM